MFVIFIQDDSNRFCEMCETPLHDFHPMGSDDTASISSSFSVGNY